MRLSRFITENMQAILAEWDAFADYNAPADAHMTQLALRDHAEEMLRDIAADIETEQTSSEQLGKSRGQSDTTSGGSAASIHGKARQENEFSLLQLSAEFRALRATVLRMWMPHVRDFSEATAHEIVRFNEAVDQALAISIVAYDERGARTRELFLAVLGHDLRSPLSTVEMVGGMMARHELSVQQVAELGERVQRSARLMKRMIGDLLGFTRIRLGSGLPVNRRPCDLDEVLRAAVADARSSHPDAVIRVEPAGGLSGCWDADRLHQLFMNLVINAVQHGARGKPVVIRARAEDERAVVDVTNFGPPIRPESMESIFKPLVQHSDNTVRSSHPSGSLGLGLYIAREVAERHGGTIGVTSSDGDGTTFRVTLPLDGVAADAAGVAADG